MALLSINEKIGNYWVKTIIKSNAYTETYRVEDADARPYFLKLFLLKNIPHSLLNDETKIVKEIEYASRLNHRNIVSFIEKGEFSRDTGDYQYYITNYFTGDVLSDYMCRQKPMSEELALGIFRNILDGLQYLHAQTPALQHNDIDPSNIMLSDVNGEAVIIDLGHVAERCCGNVPFDTSDLDIFYHANETASGIFSEQSDIFSACCVLYFMLTKVTPWNTDIQGDTYKERMKSLWQYRKNTQLDFVDSVNCSEKCKYLLKKGLALKPTDRFNSIQEIINIMDDKQEPESEKGPERRGYSSTPSGNGNGSSESQDAYAEVEIEIKRGGGNGFKDIAGMQELKDYLTQRVIYVLKNKDVAEQYRITPPNGLLLYGAPGCGKTFFAEKFAEETGFNYMLVKASDFVSGIHHATELKIKNLFKKAEQNAPIVVCFDEFDAIAPNRSAHGSEYEAKEVNELLAQLNNSSKRGIFVVATSNYPEKIDPAAKRTGRLDKMYYVPLPDFEARREMFRMYLDRRPVADDVDLEQLAKDSEGYIASDIAFMVNETAMIAAFSKSEIDMNMIKSVLSTTRPSLDPATLEMYKNLEKQISGESRRTVIKSL